MPDYPPDNAAYWTDPSVRNPPPTEYEKAKGEFSTAKEADNMLRSLRKASAYCTGDKSARKMNERIAAVARVRDGLKGQG